MGCCASSLKPKTFAKAYKVGEKLGEGSYSLVHEVQNRRTRKKYAAKCMAKADISEEDMASLLEEMTILKSLNHPNIMKVEELFDEKDNIYLVCHLYSGGELLDRIIEKEFYSEREARDITKTLLGALSYLHENDVVHRDIKLENLLLSSPAADSDIVLADFGFSKRIDDTQAAAVKEAVQLSGGPRDALTQEEIDEDNEEEPRTRERRFSTLCGTPQYCAPEIVKEQLYGQAVDVWSMGVIVFILLCGFPPFMRDTEDELYEDIMAGIYSFEKEEQDFVSKMLTVDPDERPTAAQLLDHVWMLDANVSRKQTLSSKKLADHKKKRRLRPKKHLKRAAKSARASIVKAFIAMSPKSSAAGAAAGRASLDDAAAPAGAGSAESATATATVSSVEGGADASSCNSKMRTVTTNAEAHIDIAPNVTALVQSHSSGTASVV